MSERQVRLLRNTTCWTCDASIAAGSPTWWDDERRHATCADCFTARDSAPGASMSQPVALTHRSRRRAEIMQSRASAASSPRRLPLTG